MTDRSFEDVGRAVCAMQEWVLSCAERDCLTGEEYAKMIERCGNLVSSWVMHPRHRNWHLISMIEELTK